MVEKFDLNSLYLYHQSLDIRTLDVISYKSNYLKEIGFSECISDVSDDMEKVIVLMIKNASNLYHLDLEDISLSSSSKVQIFGSCRSLEQLSVGTEITDEDLR